MGVKLKVGTGNLLVKAWGFRLFLICLFLASSAARAAPKAAADYYPYVVGVDGKAGAGELDRLAADLRPAVAVERSALVVMIHGFNTSLDQGRSDYRALARRLAAAGGPDLHPVMIGVHWPSDPGPLWAWLPQAVGYRFTSGLGFANAMRNPYLEKVRLAHRVGRLGMRALLFRLQDEFPGVPIHLLAHSLGSDIAVTALAPESGATPDDGEIEGPRRALQVDLAVLAGADLDQDAFARPDEPEIRQALERARVWWLTLPRNEAADAALELRRGAGRHDAMGNQGPTLLRADFSRLMARRGLVLDRGNIPIGHALTDYYDDRRVRSLAAAMAYLRSPERPAGQKSLLAAADRVLQAEKPRLESFLHRGSATEQLYAAWRLDPEAPRYGPVKIAEDHRDNQALGVWSPPLRIADCGLRIGNQTTDAKCERRMSNVK